MLHNFMEPLCKYEALQKLVGVKWRKGGGKGRTRNHPNGVGKPKMLEHVQYVKGHF